MKNIIPLVLVASSLSQAPSTARTPGRVDPGPVAATDEPVKFPVAPVDPAPVPPVDPAVAPVVPEPTAPIVPAPPAPEKIPAPPPAPAAPVPSKVNMGGCACDCGCPRCNCPMDGGRAQAQAQAQARPAYHYRTDSGGQQWHDTDPANLDRWVALRNAQLAAATPTVAQPVYGQRYPVLYRGVGNGPILGGALTAGACAGGSCR